MEISKKVLGILLFTCFAACQPGDGNQEDNKLHADGGKQGKHAKCGCSDGGNEAKDKDCKCGKKRKQKGGCPMCAKGEMPKEALAATSKAESSTGLAIQSCSGSVRKLSSDFEKAVKKRGLTVMASIDHGQNATKARANLRPTHLLVFGNPKVGSKLMDASPTTAIDLPLKLLIWSESESEKSQVAYNKATYLAERHQLEEQKEILGKVQNLLANLVKEVCGETVPEK